MVENDARNCPVFEGMSDDEQYQVMNLMICESYVEAETILREGNSTQILWIVEQGRCEVVKTMKDGDSHQLAVLETGSVFGEMSFFHAAPHSASVKTLTDVNIMRLSREKYEELQQISPTAAYKIATNMTRLMAERLRKMDDWVCNLVDRPEAVGHREEWREFRAKLYAGWEF